MPLYAVIVLLNLICVLFALKLCVTSVKSTWHLVPATDVGILCVKIMVKKSMRLLYAIDV